MRLGDALLRAGDSFNASIAIGIAHNSQENYDQSTNIERPEKAGNAEAEQDSKHKKPDIANHRRKEGFDGFIPYLYVCDNYCSTAKKDYEGLHFCLTCFMVRFCEKCLPLLYEGKIERRVCSPLHKHVKLYLPTPEAR